MSAAEAAAAEAPAAYASSTSRSTSSSSNSSSRKAGVRPDPDTPVLLVSCYGKAHPCQDGTEACTWYVRSKLFKHGPAMPLTRLPHLARSPLNELQQNQHEKVSLVCVRVQSPSGLALVPCALSMVDLSGQLRC